MVRIQSLFLKFPDGTFALKNVDLLISRGEFLLICGPNGSGKTTLLRALGGLLKPTSGSIQINGLDSIRHSREIRAMIGMVFQDPDSQILGETVREDVAFGPENLGLSPTEVNHRVEWALHKMGIEGLAEKPCYLLSGGEKKRVALAGVMAMKPQVILFDEPFANLDFSGIREIITYMVQLHREGHTLILTTHDVEKVGSLVDRMAVLQGGEIKLSGKPEDLYKDLPGFGIRPPCYFLLGGGEPFLARIVLHYLPGDSLLHRWDARCKLFGLILVTASLIKPSISWFLLDSFLLLAVFPLSRFPVRFFIKDFKLWVIFLSVLFLCQIVLTPGDRFSFLAWLPVSKEGLFQGGWTSWRLGLMIGYALLFTAVTRPGDLGEALIWILKPVPFLPERRIGLMVSLTLRFFSRITDQAEEVKIALQARSGDRNINPIRKAKFLALPILRNSILSVDEVTYALVARGYQEDRPSQLSKIPFLHLLPVLVMWGVWLVSIWLK